MMEKQVELNNRKADMVSSIDCLSILPQICDLAVF